MNQEAQHTILTENLKGVTTAAGALVLEANARKGGSVLIFRVISCRAVTASTVVTIEFVRGSTVYGLRTLTLTNANSWYKTRGPVRLPSDFVVRLTFSAGGNAKVCEGSVYGYEVCPE